MRKFFFLSFVFFFLTFFITPVKAQSCAEIQGVSGSISSFDPSQNTEFTCSVTVSQSFAGSRSIACGVSINGSWPMDFCPSSNGEFGGWQGNKATFNCAIPGNFIAASDKVELVGFDFSSSCGLDGAQSKELRLSRSNNPQEPQPTARPGEPQPTRNPSRPTNPSGDVCSVFRSGLNTCKSEVECVVALIKRFLGENNTAPGTTVTPTPVTQPPVSGVYRNWLELYNEVSQKTGVPAGFLKAIKEVETHSAFVDLATFSEYTVPGRSLPRTYDGCQVRGCGDAGPMQITTDRDMNGNTSCPECGGKCPNTWASLTTEVAQFSGNQNPDVCNIKDNVYGAAVLLKRCNRIANGNKNVWDTDTALIETMRCYAGNSLRNPQCGGPIPNVGGLTYCQWVICNVKGTC